ncbi:hypothetical protein COLO4_14808 [Corchorus olitorius]|uniref:Uncharacterized protein n=1 Tax=Corchorus olitorius TaxID=93759 RepID=A0A1R3JQP9_9ROSI|nr:hypothetical protein COLO4_14808 [Corchorus olitorius]
MEKKSGELGTGACSFCTAEQSQGNKIIGGAATKGRGIVGVSRIKEESETEANDGESDGCNSPIPLPPLPPPSQSSKPCICH